MVIISYDYFISEERNAEFESLKTMLSVSRFEAKQAAENLRLAKQSHLQLLKERSDERSRSLVCVHMFSIQVLIRHCIAD